jgi:nicotinamidase-related amidase
MMDVVDKEPKATASLAVRTGLETAMSDWRRETRADYERKGFAGRSGYGRSPALVVVDFINGFTDPKSPLGGDFAWEINATRQLLEAFRRGKLPIVYTTIAYAEDLHDAGIFVKKVPSLAILQRGSPLIEVDQRIKPLPGEKVIEKKYARAFFGTSLDVDLRLLGVDTVMLAGCTTSGCIRASAIDSLQYGYHTIVVREAVGDRAAGPHEANLFDIDAKYGDVVELADALDYLRSFSGSADFAAKAQDDFDRWWPRAQRG